MQEQINQLQQEIEQLKAVIYKENFEQKQIFRKDIYFINKIFMQGTTLSTGTTGLKIGNAITEKLGFFGVAPVVQQGTITTPTGGTVIDVESRTAIGQIKTALQNLGFIA